MTQKIRRRRCHRRPHPRRAFALFIFFVAVVLLLSFAAGKRMIFDDSDFLATAREKRKRDSILRETVLKDGEDDNWKHGARTIEEKRVNGGVGARLSFFAFDKSATRDFAGAHTDEERTNLLVETLNFTNTTQRTKKWSRLLGGVDDNDGYGTSFVLKSEEQKKKRYARHENFILSTTARTDAERLKRHSRKQRDRRVKAKMSLTC
jgi:hypothetical protein